MPNLSMGPAAARPSLQICHSTFWRQLDFAATKEVLRPAHLGAEFAIARGVAFTGRTPNTASFAGNCGTGIVPMFGKTRMGRMTVPLILRALGRTPDPGTDKSYLKRLRRRRRRWFLEELVEVAFFRI